MSRQSISLISYSSTNSYSSLSSISANKPPGYAPPPQQGYAPPTQQGYAPPSQPGYTPAYGAATQQNTTVFVQPSQHRTVVMEIKPPNYIVLSVITMLFFCWIFGLIGLVVGSQVGVARWGHGQVLPCVAETWELAGIYESGVWSGAIVYGGNLPGSESQGCGQMLSCMVGTCRVL